MYTGALDPVSNRADFQFIRQIIDDDTGDPIDLSAATITFEVREQTNDQDYGPSPPSSAKRLSATIANGKITIIDTGTFQVWFTETDMQTLCAGYYDIGCTVTKSGLTTQLIAAELPVVDGVVSGS